MNPLILMELVKRWEEDAREPKEPEALNNSLGNAINNAVSRGQREATREFADTLKMLIQVLGYKSK